MLEPLGVRRIVRRGELVYKAGQHDMSMAVVLRGALEAFEPRGGQEQILATGGPRDFLGDVAMLMGTASLASVRGAAEESEILEVPALQLRQALAESPGVSEPIVRAFIMRRQRLQRDREFAGLRIVAQEDSREGREPSLDAQGPCDTHLRRACIHASVWGGFVTGAILSAAATSHFGTIAVVPPCLVLLALACFIREGR